MYRSIDSYMRKKIFRWIIGILLTPFILFLLLASLLYIPAIQHYAVQKATAYASETTGMDVQINRLRLTFLFDLNLQDVSISDAQKQTLLDVGSLLVDLRFTSLLKGEIQVDGLEIRDAQVDTKELITGICIRGHLGRFFLASHGVKLPQEMVIVNRASLEDTNVEILLNDSTSEDTTSSQVNWRIALEQVSLQRTSMSLSMPGNSMAVKLAVADAALKGGYIDLGKELYKVRSFVLSADSARYDLPFEEAVNGLDFNHLSLSDIHLAVDSIRFEGKRSGLDLSLHDFRLKEKSGLSVTSLAGRISLDSSSLQIPGLYLTTPDSHIKAKVAMDYSSFTTQPQGNFHVRLDGEVGKQDVVLFAGSLPTSFIRRYPNAPIIIRLSADGNMNHMNINGLTADLADAFSVKAKGELHQLTDSINMGGKMDINLKTRHIDFIKALAGNSLDNYRLPPMQLNGSFEKKQNSYSADLRLTESKGRVSLKGAFNADRMAYNADLDVHNLRLDHFMPKDSIYTLSLKAKANGHGTDFLSSRTALKADAVIRTLEYKTFDLGGLTLNAELSKGQGNLVFESRNPLLELYTQLNTIFHKNNKNVGISLDATLNRIDLQAFGLTTYPFSTGFHLYADGQSDFNKFHQMNGGIADITLTTKDSVYRPKNLEMSMFATSDTTYAYASAGDFRLTLFGQGEFQTIMDKLEDFNTALQKQVKNKHLNQDSLRTLLPTLSFYVKSGKDNPFSKYLAAQGLDYEKLLMDFHTTPQTGINGRGYIHALHTGSIVLDTLQMQLFQDSTGVKFEGRVRNGPANEQFVFDAQAKGYLHSTGAGLSLTYLDEKGEKGIDLGIRADLKENGVRFIFSQTDPIIAYRKFKINNDNFVYLGNDRRVEANIDLVADDGTSARIYSNDNPEALQDLNISLAHWDLEELTNVLPYAPRITGMMGCDVHFIQTTENISALADVNVTDMTFEQAPLGNIAFNAIYLPNDDGSHFVDAHLLQNDNEILSASCNYQTQNDDKPEALTGDINIINMPLTLANGFLPQQTMSLDGTMNSVLSLTGTPSQPLINGWMAFNDMKIKSKEYSLNLSLPTDTVKIKNNRLDFDRLLVYSTGKEPLVVDGNIDFSKFDDINMALQVNAHNYELINAKMTKDAIAYGKVYVDLNLFVKGDLNNINMGGRLNVLGNTDVTYVLKDSPLTVEDRLHDLIIFEDFSDTLSTKKVERPKPMNLNLTTSINIDQAALVHCILSADRSSYVDLEGGGELTMLYTPLNGLTMNGRYTILNGKMKYSLPFIPLKTFTIKNGSYVEFNGDVSNPRINLAATERVKATVTENNTPRSVAFDVGLSITQTLKDMGLEFTLVAPEDMNVQNQLASMSVEQRGRLAVTMLATGMYLADSNLESFSAGNALNAFLQNEISGITGKALQTVDITLGMENETNSDGSSRTDYSFQFAKRFWGNRISIIIGGKVSTNSDVENTGQSLIDNASIEYRLDKSATRYITLFYDQNYESLLEGEITEMGVGLVLRRKMNRLGELFIFRNRKKATDPQTVNSEK